MYVLNPRGFTQPWFAGRPCVVAYGDFTAGAENRDFIHLNFNSPVESKKQKSDQLARSSRSIKGSHLICREMSRGPVKLNDRVRLPSAATCLGWPHGTITP